MRKWKKGDIAKDNKGNILEFIEVDYDDDYIFNDIKENIKVYWTVDDDSLHFRLDTSIIEFTEKGIEHSYAHGESLVYMDKQTHPEYYL
jgi:hypothetical protein